MILVTGGTGFIGQALIRQLIAHGEEVRTLIRPSRNSPKLPKGISVDVIVSSLLDERGVRAAMKDVDVVYHLVTGENHGSGTNLVESDIAPTQVVTQAAVDSGINRLIYISHLGADRASAFPVLKAKGIAENFIKTSGINYTILRSGLVYGPNDHFTEGLRVVLRMLPFMFLLPAEGETIIQPVWIDDLVNSLVWCLEDEKTINQVIEIGGAEALSLHEIAEIIKTKIGAHNPIVSINPAYLRILTVTLESMAPVFPLSTFWLDYMAANRTCSLDSLTRYFGVIPAQFNQKLDYLKRSKPILGKKSVRSA